MRAWKEGAVVAGVAAAGWSVLSRPAILVDPAIVGTGAPVCHVTHIAAHSAGEADVEHESKEPAAVTRGQNVVYQMPHDWASVTHLVGPMLDRLDDSTREVQLLIVAADAEGAAAASASVVRLAAGRSIDAVAATSARRAARLLRTRPAQVVAGPPAELLALVQGSSLKLEHVRIVVLAWVDELLAGGGEPALETLMAAIPKDAARVIAANEITAEVEALIERYARRARRVAPAVAEGDAGTALEYVTVSSVSRLPALRRLLDELDPSRGIVYVRSDESEREASDLVRALGYGMADGEAEGTVRVARSGGTEPTDVVVLYDIPASREELREAAGARPSRIVALAQPRQLASLRVLAGGATVLPHTLSEPGTRARDREESVRSELRDTLAAGGFSRELLALEPLLDSYDGIEIAAAALRLLQQARDERDTRARHPEVRSATGAQPPMTRLYLNVGAMDNARPGDLVGAITGEAGITSTQIGKIDIRENHTIVEVAADAAESVVSKLTGTLIRGRRVVARLDQERPGGGRAGAPRGRAGGRPGDRGVRHERGDRGERGNRSDRGDRADRGPRREGGEGRGGGGNRDRGGRPFGRRPSSGENADRAARPPRSGENE